MTIENTFVSKFLVGFVAIAMALSLVAPAQAQTEDELQAQIDQLMATISALQAQTGATATGSSTAGVCPYAWTRALSSGSTGADVMALQKFLNADVATQVSASGAGSAGMETSYFGPATAAAVSNFQVKYRDDVLTPLGLVNPTGFFGQSSMAKANMLCSSAAPTTPTTPGDEDEDEDEDDFELGGEAALDAFEIESSDDDDIEEGAEDAPVAELTVEFSDGDAEISRMDIQLLADGDTNTSDVRPWDAFESVSLWVDGDKVGEIAADDEDDYLDEDLGTLRFTDLDIVGMEDEELEITVAVTVQGNLDTAEMTTWDFYVTALRFFDADGVATTEDSAGDMGAEADVTASASFTVDEAGSEDELIVKTSTNDPDGTTLQLEDDAKSDWYTIFVFDLDTDDSINDIEINSIPVSVTVGSGTVATFVDDMELVIDGTTIDDFDWGADGATRVATFDVDGDVVIDAGERVEAELRVRFKALHVTNEGVLVDAEVTSANADAIDAEGADDLGDDQTSGAAGGDEHALRTQGISVSSEDATAVVTTVDSTTNDYATYEVEVEITAFEQDVFISTDPAASISYTLETGAGSTTFTGSRTPTLTSTADDEAGYFEISEGSTETLTFTVTYVPGVANVAARMQLESITFDDDGSSEDQTWTASPESDYRTSVVTIVD